MSGEAHIAQAWKAFREGCEEAYRSLLEGDSAKLRDHNIVADGDVELDFALSLANVGAPGSGGAALDVGCGAGYLSGCLRRRRYAVTGIEISEAAVTAARRQYPDLEFILGDATDPLRLVAGRQFDLICVREFHPFTRIDEFDFQLRILTDYLSLLKSGGWLVLAHARRCECLDYKRLLAYCRRAGLLTVGPTHMFLNKRLGVSSRRRVATRLLSILSWILSCATGHRWIEFLLLRPQR